MGQHQVVLDLEEHQRMLQAVFALAQRVAPTAPGRHALTNVQVPSLHKGRLALPGAGRKDCFDLLESAAPPRGV